MFFIPLLSLESGIIVNKFQTLLLSIHNSGVMRFDVMSHGEKERTEDYKTKQWQSRRHHRCIERRSLFAISISNLYTKRLSQNSYQESVRYASVALCAVGTSLTLRYLRPSVTPCAYYIRLLVYHSIFRKNLLLPCYHVLNTLLPCLPLPCLISSITLLPCLLLLCYHVLNILLPCLEYPVTMSLITLSHVFHYSVTMSLITLSHAFHYPVSIKECKTTKKS